MSDIKDREYYLMLLKEKSEELGRLPKKSDLSVAEMSYIKSFWGPWPKALRAAGLIPKKNDTERR